jgi:Trp operon repressor
LDAWEKAMYRVYVLADEDSRTGVGNCVRLASDILKANLSLKQIVERLDEIGSVTREEAAAVLSRIDAYEEWITEELIYFFWKYEESLAKRGRRIY